MLGSHRVGAIEVRRLAIKLLDGCAYTVRWPVILLKLKLVSRLRLYKEYEINGWNLLKYTRAKNCHKR